MDSWENSKVGLFYKPTDELTYFHQKAPELGNWGTLEFLDALEAPAASLFDCAKCFWIIFGALQANVDWLKSVSIRYQERQLIPGALLLSNPSTFYYVWLYWNLDLENGAPFILITSTFFAPDLGTYKINHILMFSCFHRTAYKSSVTETKNDNCLSGGKRHLDWRWTSMLYQEILDLNL